MLTSGEDDDLEILSHLVQEFLGEGPDIKDHLESQILQFLPRRLSVILGNELVRQLVEVFLLLGPRLQLLLVLHVRVNQRFVQV